MPTSSSTAARRAQTSDQPVLARSFTGSRTQLNTSSLLARRSRLHSPEGEGAPSLLSLDEEGLDVSPFTFPKISANSPL